MSTSRHRPLPAHSGCSLLFQANENHGGSACRLRGCRNVLAAVSCCFHWPGTVNHGHWEVQGAVPVDGQCQPNVLRPTIRLPWLSTYSPPAKAAAHHCFIEMKEMKNWALRYPSVSTFSDSFQFIGQKHVLSIMHIYADSAVLLQDLYRLLNTKATFWNIL